MVRSQNIIFSPQGIHVNSRLYCFCLGYYNLWCFCAYAAILRFLHEFIFCPLCNPSKPLNLPTSQPPTRRFFKISPFLTLPYHFLTPSLYLPYTFVHTKVPKN